MGRFASVPEQPEAKRLLAAALADAPAHAYLLHGPPGVGKRTAALAFAGALLGDERRVESRTHPDLYVLEPLGEMIRIDDVRALRHDLHMRPYEAQRRVYLVLDADRMNEDAADALLSNILSANLTQVSLRQNEDMRKISAWAAILAFPTAIAGIYGMNFRHMPEIEQVWGYPAVLLFMATGCLLLYRRFKRVGWL